MIGFIKPEAGIEYLTPDIDKIHTVGSITFVKDDETWFVTNYDSDYSYLAKYELTTKSFEKVLDFEHESLMMIKFNRYTNVMYVLRQIGPVDNLSHYDLTHDQLASFIAPDPSVSGVVKAGSGAQYVKGKSATVTTNIFKYENESWEQITKNKVLVVTPEDMVEPEVITYHSFDDLGIEALLFRAKPENANGYT